MNEIVDRGDYYQAKDDYEGWYKDDYEGWYKDQMEDDNDDDYDDYMRKFQELIDTDERFANYEEGLKYPELV